MTSRYSYPASAETAAVARENRWRRISRAPDNDGAKSAECLHLLSFQALRGLSTDARGASFLRWRRSSGNRVLLGLHSSLEKTSPILVLAILVITAALTARPSRLLLDPDTYWHIVVGKQIWSTLTLPRYDEFSYTMAGAPWIAKEWLSQLLLSGAFVIGGWTGVIYLSAAVVALAFTLILKILLEHVKATIAIALIAIFLAAISGHLLARPHIFVFPLLVAWTSALVRCAEQQRAPNYLLLAIVALWANLHASAPVAAAIAASIGVLGLTEAPPEKKSRLFWSWAIFIVGAVAATGITPYGYASLLVAYKLLGSGPINATLLEWRPLGLDWHSVAPIVALLGSLALIIPPWRNVARAVPILLCGCLMIQHVRFVDLFAIVTPIVMAKPLADRFRSFGAPSPLVSKRTAVVAIASFACLNFAIFFNSKPAPPDSAFPIAALEAAKKANVDTSGNVFNDYSFGGFLIFNGVKTFIDGRAELFLGGLLEEFDDDVRNQKRDQFSALLDRYNASWAIVPPHSAPEGLLIRLPLWRRIYADENATIYARAERVSEH